MRQRFLVTLFLSLFFYIGAFCQDGGKRYTEEEVSIEKLFIEAKKHKLLRDFDGAKDLFRQILKKYRNHDVAAYELAEIYLREQETEDALHHINLAIGIDAKNKWYLLLKAKILEGGDRYLDAADVYKKIALLNPTNMKYQEQLAFLYSKGGEYQMAIDVFDNMEDRIGVTEKSALIKHDFYKKLGKRAKALDELLKLTEYFPSDISIKHILANYYKSINKDGAARQIYQEILALNPNDARANVAMASTFKKQGNHGDYLHSIRPIIENEHAGIDVKIAELMPYVRKMEKSANPEELEALLALVSVLEKTHPTNAKSFALYGDLLSIAGQSSLAVEKYQKAIDIDESNYLVWEQMLMLQAELKDMKAMAVSSAEALELFPNQANIFYLNGIAHINLGAFDNAQESLEQSLLMTGSNKELKFSVLALLGKVYHETSNYEDSEEAYERALAIHPNDQRVLNDYAYHLAQRGQRLADAHKMVDKALEKNRQDPRFQATKAWIFYREQNLEDARSRMQESLDLGGAKYAFVLEAMGDIYYKLDLNEKALKHWKLAKEVGGGSKWLERKISEEKLIEAQ
jgi:tetratricopeptide (TPR) repeat protein